MSEVASEPRGLHLPDRCAATSASTGPVAASTGPVTTTYSVTVAIACFSERRWDMLLAAIDSVRRQDYPHDLVVCVDRNEDLYQRLVALDLPDVRVVRNSRAGGASGARNTVALNVASDFVAFLDDDACAEPGWLSGLMRAVDRPDVLGAGGRIDAAWLGPRPRWFPPEFGWVVGASIPTHVAEPVAVRNVWTGSMVVNRSVFASCGGFREDFGKRGGAAEPEDTELCLRLGLASGRRWLYVPSAVIRHAVPAERATLSYFVRRCRMEGRGKAALRTLAANKGASLSAEKRYLRSMLPAALIRNALAVARGDLAGAARSAAIALGAATTAGAFLLETCRRSGTVRAGRGAGSRAHDG